MIFTACGAHMKRSCLNYFSMHVSLTAHLQHLKLRLHLERVDDGWVPRKSSTIRACFRWIR